VVTWESTARVLVAERFNLTEGAILARDLLEAACNYSKRTNSSAMKMEIARHIVAKYTVMNVRMTQGEVTCHAPRKNRKTKKGRGRGEGGGGGVERANT